MPAPTTQTSKLGRARATAGAWEPGAPWPRNTSRREACRPTVTSGAVGAVPADSAIGCGSGMLRPRAVSRGAKQGFVRQLGPYMLCAVAVAGLLVAEYRAFAGRPVAREARRVAGVHLGRARGRRARFRLRAARAARARAVPRRRRAADPARAAGRVPGGRLRVSRGPRGVLRRVPDAAARSARTRRRNRAARRRRRRRAALGRSHAARRDGVAGARLHGRDRR